MQGGAFSGIRHGAELRGVGRPVGRSFETHRIGETASPSRAKFDEALTLIDAAKARALAAVNTALIELHWTLGECISRRIDAEGWG